MTLEKAIEIIDDLALPGEVLLDSVDVDALKLGIEALKVVNKFRILGDPLSPGRLPGEDG